MKVILIFVVVFIVVSTMSLMKVSSICSREEEKEWENGNET